MPLLGDSTESLPEMSPVQDRTSQAPVASSRQAGAAVGETGVPAPAVRSVAVQLQGAEKRLDRLLGRAVTDLPCLTKSVYAELERELPRPGLFHTMRSAHSALMDAARACDRASAALSGIPARAFSQVPLPAELFAVLKNYAEAQNGLYARACAYMAKEAAGDAEKMHLQPLVSATQYRLSEALNLVASLQLAGGAGARSEENDAVRATMQDRLAEKANMTFAAGMKALSPGMHEGTLRRELSGRAGALFAELDRLEQRAGTMSEDEFKTAAAGVKTLLDNLRADVDRVTAGAGRPEAEGAADGGANDASLHGGARRLTGEEKALCAGLKDVLDRCTARLDALSKSSLHEEVLLALHDFAPLVDPSLGRSLESRTSLSVLKNAVGKVRGDLEFYNSEISAVKRGIQKGTIGVDEVRTRLTAALDRLRSPECALLYTLYKTALKRVPNVQVMQNILQSYGVNIRHMETKVLFRMARRGDFLNGDTGAFLTSLAGTPMARRNIVEAEAADIAAMYGRTRADRSGLRGSYVTAAFEHNVGLDTLLEASLRGIPVDQLEMRAGDDSLKSSRVLGQGAANTVSLCAYRGENGEELRLVFKPEVAAQQGFATLYAHKLGYRDETRVMQINVAASRVADAIGCGDVVARSSIGVHDGRVGLFMEQAPGRTAADVLGEKPFVSAPGGRELSLGDLMGSLVWSGKDKIVRANLMRELNRLEWADVLSGQVDRHRDNYLVHINPATGDVRVTGIDNDASFGTRKLGATKVDISGNFALQSDLRAAGVALPSVKLEMNALSEEQKQILRDRLPNFREDAARVDVSGMFDIQKALADKGVVLPSMVVDCRGFRDNQIELMKQHLGFNQLFSPSHIDRETFTKLMAVREDEYRRSLRGCLDDDALDAAVERLRDAKALAQELQNAGRVVDDWKNSSVLRTMQRDISGQTYGTLGFLLRHGFFVRDFMGRV